MNVFGPMPVEEQQAASLMMLRLAFFFAGLVAASLLPVVLLLMVIRDRVGGCNWGTSKISGTADWDLLPPQLTCTWSAEQLDEINAWSAEKGEAAVELQAGATTISEQIPVTSVAWITVGMFVFGLVLLRLAMVLRHRPAPASAQSQDGQDQDGSGQDPVED